MGKPSDPYDADAMLHALSGKTHKVVTVCLDYYFSDGGKMTDSFSQETLVEFYELSDDEISEYVDRANLWTRQALTVFRVWADLW